MERKKFIETLLLGGFFPWIDTLLSVKQTVIESYKQELEMTVKPLFENHLEELKNLRLNGNLANLDQLRMYYPIYRTAQEAFNVPWYLLWLIHDAESGLSTNPAAFGNTRENYGAMQRAKKYYDELEVELITFSYQYLANLLQNHPDDWREILWAAAKISRDAENAQRLYVHRDWNRALEEAQHAYCREDEAERRKERFRRLKEMFTPSHLL